MLSHEELVFAQHFPFSNAAKRVLQQHSFELEKTPKGVIERAAILISRSAKGMDYIQKDLTNSPELLVQETQAFPIAKILVSAINRFDLFDRLAETISKATFFYLTNEKKPREAMLELAYDLGTEFEPDERNGFFCRIPVSSFLKAGFREEFMKLVNQPVEHGTVFLGENDFARFLSETSREKIRQSLPVDLKHVPNNLAAVSRQLKEQLVFREKKSFSFESFGSTDPNSFPPCMAKLYQELLEGKNVNHPGRFNAATFLVAIGMPIPQIVELFRKTPNFDEKITRYQVERIAGKGKAKYSPSSCAKMRSYGLCVANCPVSHPLQFYQREMKNKPSSEKSAAAMAPKETN
jgi:DNA primase large subunit